jgi:hypothetical protein
MLKSQRTKREEIVFTIYYFRLFKELIDVTYAFEKMSLNDKAIKKLELISKKENAIISEIKKNLAKT